MPDSHRDQRAERQRVLLRELVAARTAVRVARQHGDIGAERRARSRLLAVFSALQRTTR